MGNLLRVGVIGCGAISQLSHIKYLLDYSDHFCLVAISDVANNVLSAVGEHFRIARRYADYRDLLSQEDVEAVLICHSGSHHDAILDAIKADKHIFVEKPVGWNTREVEEVATAQKGFQKTLQVGYHKLYDPAVHVAKEHLRVIGDLGFARITVLHPTNELGLSPHRIRRGDGKVAEGHVDPGSWEQQIELYRSSVCSGDVGPLVDEALGGHKDDQRLRLAYGLLSQSIIHQVYVMFDLLGQPARVVMTELWRQGASIHVLVEYPGGLRCSLDWHFFSHLKNYHEEYAFYGNHDRVALRFPFPYYLNFPSPVIVQGGERETSWEKRIVVSFDEAFRKELLEFYDNVKTKRTPQTTVSQAVKHTRFIQEVINAAKDMQGAEEYVK